ncbi:MAG TPA: hypothetical protein VLE49_19615 [Anaerolineales bacterium]|nr:hypothetical protein [Anaerolineales bacterium]
MRRNLHWSVQLAVLLGLMGLFVMSLSLWLGILMILVGLIVPIVALRQSRQPARSMPKPQANQVRTTAFPGSPPHRQVDRNKLGVLRYTLHQANLDSNAPVFHISEGKAVTVRDILVEMIAIADAHGRSIEELAKDIVAMYPRIFDNVNLALRQYPDEELAKTYIAHKAMTGAGWKLDQDRPENL